MSLEGLAINALGHILIVDDDPEQVELLTSAVARAGYRVTTAGSGLEAVDRAVDAELLADPVDLVITDMLMPGFTGLEMLEALRAEGINVPYVVITGGQFPGAPRETTQEACGVWLLKPVRLDGLLETVACLLTGRPGHGAADEAMGCGSEARGEDGRP